MLKKIIEELFQDLSSIEGIRYVAEDWGQLDYEQPPVQWPCALVDMQDVRYSQTGMGGLLADCTFTVQLTDQAPQRVSSRASDTQKERSLQIFGIIDRVIQDIHAKDSAEHSPFMLEGMQRVNLPELQSYVLTFKTQFRTDRPQATAPLTGFSIRTKRA